MTISAPGQGRVRATVKSRVRFRPGRTFFEGTDAFVNKCINGGFTIKSRGGRLYCRTPSVTTKRMFGLRVKR